MKYRVLTIINTYIKYFIGHIGKIFFFLLIILCLYPKARIDVFESIKNILFFYVGYMSIYFFNDYIDRERDLKRVVVHPTKLVLTKNELLLLGILSILTPLIFFFINENFITMILLLISVIIGIVRSFFTEKNIREISLVILSVFKLFSIYYIVYKNLNINFDIFILFLQISLVYSAGYYVYKYPLDKFRKILYFFVYPFVGLLIAILYFIKLEDIFIPVILVFYSTIFVRHVYSMFKKEIKKDEVKKLMRNADLKYITVTLILAILVILKLIFYF